MRSVLLALITAILTNALAGCHRAQPRDAPAYPEHVVGVGTRAPTCVAEPRFLGDGAPYFELEVERPAELRADTLQRAPGAPRPARRGQVLAQFVVDSTGRPDVRSGKILITPGPTFTAAVCAELPELRFRPALLGGRPVSQFVQRFFEFRKPPG